MDREKVSAIVKQNADKYGSLRGYARHLGVTLGAVQGWIEGRSKPTTENLVKIANDAGYSLEELMGYLNSEAPVNNQDSFNEVVKHMRLLSRRQIAEAIQIGANMLAEV